jgi:hypothetical protein
MLNISFYFIARAEILTINARPRNFYHYTSQETLTMPLFRFIRRLLLTLNQKRRRSLWNAIFKDYAWITMAAGTEPVLIGLDLDRYCYKRGWVMPTYMVLSTWDTNGDLLQKEKQFFASLLPGYEYDKTRQEVTFKSGLVLNVHSVTVNSEEAGIEPTKMLEGFETQYMLWKDPNQVKHVTKHAFSGPYRAGTGNRDRLLQPTDPKFLCELSLNGLPEAFSKRWFGNQNFRTAELVSEEDSFTSSDSVMQGRALGQQ